MKRKSFLGLTLSALLLAGCTVGEPPLLVVPSEDTDLGESETYIADVSDAATDVQLVFSAVVVTSSYSWDPDFVQYMWAGEVVNDSFFAVYLLEGTGTSFDADGFPVDSFYVDRFVLRPGERAALGTYVLTDAESVEVNFRALAAREIDDRDLGSLDVADVNFRRDGDDVSVGGFVTNNLGLPASELAVFAWCQDSDGAIHAVDTWRHYDAVLPGERLPFVATTGLDSRRSVVNCSASAVELRPFANSLAEGDPAS